MTSKQLRHRADRSGTDEWRVQSDKEPCYPSRGRVTWANKNSRTILSTSQHKSDQVCSVATVLVRQHLSARRWRVWEEPGPMISYQNVACQSGGAAVLRIFCRNIFIGLQVPSSTFSSLCSLSITPRPLNCNKFRYTLLPVILLVSVITATLSSPQ